MTLPSFWRGGRSRAWLGVLVVAGTLWLLLGYPSQRVALPPPEARCHQPVTWHGIKPGISTRQEVHSILGRPDASGVEWFNGGIILVDAYDIPTGDIAAHARDMIFFRADGVVSWIEAIVADRDGRFHPIQETVAQLGPKLDAVYANSNYRPGSGQYDVLSGPDQLYVWSECGVAVNTLIGCFTDDLGELDCPGALVLLALVGTTSTNLTLRHPAPGSEGIIAGEGNVVLMKFLFEPTSYAAFEEHYRYNIPFGQWDIFLDDLIDE